MPVNQKPPKCLTCKSPTELITCHCQDQSQQKYFCWTCKQHYPLKYGFEFKKNKALIQKAKKCENL